MGDLTPDVVRRGLKKLFKERTRFVGHNLKYDFTLLRRNGIDRSVLPGKLDGTPTGVMELDLFTVLQRSRREVPQS